MKSKNILEYIYNKNISPFQCKLICGLIENNNTLNELTSYTQKNKAQVYISLKMLVDKKIISEKKIGTRKREYILLDNNILF